MIHFFSFGNRDFAQSIIRIGEEALSSGFFDTITTFTDIDLPQEVNQFCMENPRGYGYWIWKPHFHKLMMDRVNYGDIIVYADAGSTINQMGAEKFATWISMVRTSPFANISSQLPYHLEREWTKGDTFKYFESANDVKETGQLEASFSMIRKNAHTIMLVNMWRDTMFGCKNLIDDSPSVSPNENGFVENRHDQSIWSVVRKTYGTIIIPEATSPGNPVITTRRK